MTKNDIIKAAFRVWGRELYQSTSLTTLARELGVSKPAIYRHFQDKQALLNAMYETFFDEYTAFIKPWYEKAHAAQDAVESLFIMMRTIVDYYARNVDAFIFSLIQVYGDPVVGGRDMAAHLKRRGVDLSSFARFKTDTQTYPSMVQLILATLTFIMAHFHKHEHTLDEHPSEERIQYVIALTEEKVATGLGFKKELIEAIDYEGLENRISGTIHDFEEDCLLRAVAGAVAEAGPWNASMEMVARRSGLSKSSLYSHFKNKQDMLRQLFLTEFDRIVRFAELGKQHSAVPEEQLYLVIISMADYLRSRPEILVAIDWIRTRRLDLGHIAASSRVYQVISDIQGLGSTGEQDTSGTTSELTPQWILFLIVNTLMHRPAGMAFSELPNSSIRVLFKFIVSGIKGCTI
ncbi:MAG: TetR/AcrR family transcriptional regulator [Treponema sp.]|jgi:AcrR family transcriptional regulator|nr:TetR/AcrR family transcriptional regulator [Treponema sp.]